MRLVTARREAHEFAGVLTGKGKVADLSDHGYGSVLSLVEAGPEAWAEVAEAASALPTVSTNGLELLPPIPRPPRNIFCVGVNYRKHFDEGDRPTGSSVPESPVIFTKPWTCLVGQGAEVSIDRRATQKADWEAEIAVVVGKSGRNIPVSEAASYVFGYTLANDLSARDLQLEHGQFGQWFKGKSLDGFCPMGPAILTSDELGARSIDVHLEVNGDVQQRFSSDEMVNSVAQILARLSLGMTLLPGDVVLTGTSAGVGHWQKPPRFLAAGDVVTIRSSILGELTTTLSEKPEG